eukprot:363625-Chlamydomonas_euryale.AAC.6
MHGVQFVVLQTCACSGKEQQPFYHILVDERDWELEVETGMPPVAYGATFVQVEIVATGCSSSAFLGGSVGKTGARGTRDTFMVVVLPFPFLVFPLPLPVFSCLLSPCVIQSCFPPPSFLALPPSCLFFYFAEELLTCPELEDPPRAWVEEHGSEPLEHSFLNVLFLGVDGRGDYVPCRHLRNKFNVQRRDVFKPGEDPNKDD